ncbi:MAG: DUF2334 domain-containing protein [Bacillota bacterium]|nr:DUF2334 domain-containing protein [Bacillota bacterium]
MSAKYIYRMDDITPTMNWKRFWQYINLFEEHGVKPLLGIVPDNKDPKLMIEESKQDFWETMRRLQADGIVEICQHGYQHVYVNKEGGLLGPKYGFKAQSEFAGLSYEDQYKKIEAGKEILQREKIYTDVWMAPSHSFDNNTLKALYELGFRAVTDGIALFPYNYKRMDFVPQQYWGPQNVFVGIVTICLHTDTVEEALYDKIKKHLESDLKFISFSEARNFKSTHATNLLNRIFNFYYMFRSWFNENKTILKTKRMIKKVIRKS